MKTASPIIPVNYDILAQSREEYMGEQPQFPDREQFASRSPEYEAWLEKVTPVFDAQRERRKEWDRTIRHAIATGRISLQEAVDLGFTPSGGHETDGRWETPKWGRWQPLPDRLYHVTTNVPAIAAEGRLRSPFELDHTGGARGLGSFGTDDSISLTESLEEARNIEQAMREASDVASGRIPIRRLYEMAKRGEGAQRPWLRDMFPRHAWSKGLPQGLYDVLNERKRYSPYHYPEDHPLRQNTRLLDMNTPEEWAKHGFTPDRYSHRHQGRDEEFIINPSRPMTEEEKRQSRFDWWRNPWLAYREHAGGLPDPLFASTDANWYANLKPSDIGIVETQPVPGGHGYPMNALGEWRIPTGEAVNITGIGGQPYPPRTSHDKTSDVHVPAEGFELGKQLVNQDHINGVLPRGTPIHHQDSRIPDTVYHVTTNLPAVQRSGYLRAGGEGGLGGDANDRVVSMTINPGIAQQLASDMRWASGLHRALGEPPAHTWNDQTRQWEGDRTPWAAQLMPLLRQRAEEEGWKFPELPSVAHQSYGLNDWLNHHFAHREGATTDRQPRLLNPLFFGEHYKHFDPDKIGVVPVPRESLNNGALLTDFDLDNSFGLQEIRSYGDIPLSRRTSHTKLAHPLYVRWVYSPTDNVTLSDNTGDPLDVRYHTDLARELNEPNLVHGYAYPLDGAWRLFDWDNKPISDPRIIAQVMRSLMGSQAPSGPENGSWDPSWEADWTRVHHGLPG